MRAKKEKDNENVILFFCPGCEDLHRIPITKQDWCKGVWQFNGNFEKPTFTPSIVLTTGKYVDPNWIEPPAPGKLWSVICHSVIKDGQIKYAGDTTHRLVGKIVDLPEIE